jgi:beta-N-acetylhexosaminidase
MSQSLTLLSPEQKIGQLFNIGLRGTELDAETIAFLKHIQPGGVTIFARNVASATQLRSYLDGIRNELSVEPILSIDQEGGLVDRLRKISTPMPAARKIREHGDLAGARTLGKITGEMLRILGFNTNFAPVIDILTEEREQLSNGLYSRSFGRTPGEVFGYSLVYLHALQATGCLGCLKHFPGIGAGAIDSHEEIPVIHLSQDDLIAQDLAPYIELFQMEDDRVKAVMVSHGGYPQIDIIQGIAGGRLEPATLSRNIVTKLLREELGFRHLTITDDLEMGAITKHHTIEEAAEIAFDVGNDVLLICSKAENIRRAYDGMLEAYKDGRFSEKRLNDSLQRIANFKALMKPPLDFDEERLKELSNEVAELNKKLNYVYGGRV